MSEQAVFLSAGEPSGDLHGAELARELRIRRPRLRLFGLGGSRMAAEGVTLIAGLDRTAVLGFAEILRHIPDLVRLRLEVRRLLVEQGIDLLVPIDYPGFNLPLARFARQRGIKVVYYIAPQVWAWHESRARQLARNTDLVCVVLPFEAERLERWGVRTRFVGHPLLDRRDGPREVPRSGSTPPVLGIFPGSRRQEVDRMLGPFLAAARLLRETHRNLEVLIAEGRDLNLMPYRDFEPAEPRRAEDIIHRAHVAITKSGTITLQLALAGVPMVVGYRVNPLTYHLAKRLVRVEHISLVNLVAGRTVVPELVQHTLTAERLASAASPLFDPAGPDRAAQLGGFGDVASRLGEPGAAARVADECLRLLGPEA